MDKVRQHVLLELDCILDTRLGTMIKDFPNEYLELDLSKYLERTHDKLWELLGVTEDVWKASWEGRDVLTLENSKATMLALKLKEIFVHANVSGLTSPMHEPLVIHLNTYPYKLTPELKSEFVNAVRDLMFFTNEVKTVYLPPDMLDPEYLKENYQSLFVYDFIGWLTLHRKSLETTRIPTVTFQTPGYIHDTNPDLLAAVERESLNPFDIATQALSEYLSLVYVDTKMFSLPYPS